MEEVRLWRQAECDANDYLLEDRLVPTVEGSVVREIVDNPAILPVGKT